jgi:hypothetical protein
MYYLECTLFYIVDMGAIVHHRKPIQSELRSFESHPHLYRHYSINYSTNRFLCELLERHRPRQRVDDDDEIFYTFAPCFLASVYPVFVGSKCQVFHFSCRFLYNVYCVSSASKLLFFIASRSNLKLNFISIHRFGITNFAIALPRAFNVSLKCSTSCSSVFSYPSISSTMAVLFLFDTTIYSSFSSSSSCTR